MRLQRESRVDLSDIYVWKMKAEFSKLSKVFVFNSETLFYCCKNVYISEYSLNLIYLKTTVSIVFYIYRVTFLVLITLVRQKAKFSQLSNVSELTGQLINVVELIEIIMLLS